jgi:hypothetical protein
VFSDKDQFCTSLASLILPTPEIDFGLDFLFRALDLCFCIAALFSLPVSTALQRIALPSRSRAPFQTR